MQAMIYLKDIKMVFKVKITKTNVEPPVRKYCSSRSLKRRRTDRDRDRDIDKGKEIEIHRKK